MNLNFKVYGQGFPVIILHGLFGSLDNWQTIARRLSTHFSVFVLDQRNHGKSPHSDDFSIDLLAEDLREWMESNHIYEAHLIGHSMGGKTAMKFALEHPDMVEKLIIADMSPAAYKGSHEEIFKALLSVDLTNLTGRDQVDAYLQNYIPSLSVRLFLMKGLTRNKDKKFEWKFNVKALHRHYSEILKAIESDLVYDEETLFIRGSNSDYINKENETAIRKLFPNFKIATIPDSGHWMHAENPDKFLDVVSSFLDN